MIIMTDDETLKYTKNLVQHIQDVVKGQQELINAIDEDIDAEENLIEAEERTLRISKEDEESDIEAIKSRLDDIEEKLSEGAEILEEAEAGNISEEKFERLENGIEREAISDLKEIERYLQDLADDVKLEARDVPEELKTFLNEEEEIKAGRKGISELREDLRKLLESEEAIRKYASKVGDRNLLNKLDTAQEEINTARRLQDSLKNLEGKHEQEHEKAEEELLEMYKEGEHEIEEIDGEIKEENDIISKINDLKDGIRRHGGREKLESQLNLIQGYVKKIEEHEEALMKEKQKLDEKIEETENQANDQDSQATGPRRFAD